MPDLFGNVTQELPPWLTNTPSPSAIVDKAFQAKDQSIRNYSELAQVNQRQQELEMAKQRNDQAMAMAPLLKQHQEQQNQLMANNIALSSAAVDDEIQSKEMATRVASVRLLASKSPNGFADPLIESALDEAAIKTPGIIKSPLWQQTRQDVTTAKQFVQQRELRKLANERLPPGMIATEYYNRLMDQANDADANGDPEAAADLRRHAEADKAFNQRRGFGDAPAARQTPAQMNSKSVIEAKAALDAALASGDPTKIKDAQFAYQTISAASKMPGMTDSAQRLSLSNRTIPERIQSNATMAWDQVNDLISNLGGGSVGPMGVFNQAYQKTIGNISPSAAGTKAISDQEQLAQLKNSLEAMASADRTRSGALIKEIQTMMPSTGLMASKASALDQLTKVREWVSQRARQAAIDKGVLPPPWAMTMEDAADAVIKGDQARSMGADPNSDQFKARYLTEDQYRNLFQTKKTQPPSNAPIQLPNP